MNLAGMATVMTEAIQGPLAEMANSQRHILEAIGMAAQQSNQTMAQAQHTTMQHMSP